MDEMLSFSDRKAFRNWLVKHYDRSDGIWLVFSKTRAVESIKAQEALEEALCFGWIDGQMNRISAEQYQKKFTPRRKKSKWSEKNKTLARQLIESGQMTAHGIQTIEQAKKDGMWDAPKKIPITAEQVAILLEALEGREPARTHFMNMSLSVRQTYTALYLDAKKEETRIKRLEKITERLNDNLKPM